MARRPQPYSPPFPLVQAMQAGQWARAEEMLRKLLKTSQPHPQMLLDFGRVLAARDKHEEALKFLKRAAKKDPANPLCHFEAGLSAMRLRQWREARQAFGAAMKLAPGEAVIALNLATVLMETAEHAQAAQLLRQALAAAGLSDEQVLYARTLLVEALREWRRSRRHAARGPGPGERAPEIARRHPQPADQGHARAHPACRRHAVRRGGLAAEEA